MKSFVLDASVAAKWFLPSVAEPHANEAKELLSAYDRGQVGFSAPDVFWPELGNVLWKAVQRTRISVAHAEVAVSQAQSLTIRSLPSVQLLPVALKIAVAHKRAIYDSLYLAAALTIREDFVTADEKLVNALGARYPIRWIGSWATLI